MESHDWRKKWDDETTTLIQSELVTRGRQIPCIILSVISLRELLAPSKRTKNTIPRPQNVWVLYRKYVQAKISTNPQGQVVGFGNVSKLASRDWLHESGYVKDFFAVLQDIAQRIHKKVFPQYQYKPNPTQQSTCGCKSLKMEISFLLNTNQLHHRSYFVIQSDYNVITPSLNLPAIRQNVLEFNENRTLEKFAEIAPQN